MKYLVLARRYRPKRFCEVIGQEAIVTTLKNALRFDRVAHAYLFCGSRGVGKTTVARLFAKALNCQSPDPDNEPCNRCPSCMEILSGQSLDVIEIDGASNRGIDDIRQLNETIGYAPSHGKYKIYIIDEVHMLTKEAFNALLKTLEEPPERAKFFFATTEPHKVLPTIVSRCQRFDMRRLTEAQIAHKLISIAEDLKRDVSPEAIHLMSSFAEGSLRDAESVFDQILCFTEGGIQAEQVRNVLGLVPDELFFELDSAFNEGRVSFAFELVERLFQMGKDLGHFLEQLIGHYRHLAIAKAMGISSLSLPEPLSSRVNDSAKLYTQAQLFYILEILLNAFAPLQKSPMQRASLESVLLHLLRSKNRIPIEVLIRRLNELEHKLSENNPLSSDPNNSIDRISEEPAKIAKEPIVCADLSANCLQTESKANADLTPAPVNTASGEPSEKEEIPAENECSNARTSVSDDKSPKTADNLQPAAATQKIDVRPVPFNPFKPRLNAAAEATKPVTSSPEKNDQSPQHNTPMALEKEPITDPKRYETLLRFAAVELEGTIKN